MSEKPYRRDNLICVATTAGQIPAQVLKSKLEAAGIPVLLQYDSASLVWGLTVDGLGQVRVMVPEAMAADASALIEPDPLDLDDEDSADYDESDDQDACSPP